MAGICRVCCEGTIWQGTSFYEANCAEYMAWFALCPQAMCCVVDEADRAFYHDVEVLVLGFALFEDIDAWIVSAQTERWKKGVPKFICEHVKRRRLLEDFDRLRGEVGVTHLLGLPHQIP